MADYVALLRGINVGGKNKLPMKELAALFVKAGCEQVSTFIASGNVLFDAPKKLAAQVPTLLPKAIEKKFGFAPPIVLRTAAELAAVPARTPFEGADEDALYVMFLADAPDEAKVAALDPNRSPGDEYAVVGKEI